MSLKTTMARPTRPSRPDLDPGERFSLTPRPLPDPLGRDATYRLKLALKLLRRTCAFQCVGIDHAAPPPARPARERFIPVPTVPIPENSGNVGEQVVIGDGDNGDTHHHGGAA